MLCTAPGHVAAWKKQGDWFGYCSFFKSEFLLFDDQINFLQQYPFFRINESNLLPIDVVTFRAMKQVFRQIVDEQGNADKFSTEIIRSYFQGVLWQVRRIYEKTVATPSQRAGSALAARFQWLVNEWSLEKISVGEYAELLHVSPNHLSQIVKHVTGQTAKHIISQRRLLEAKHLLAYTNNSIADVSRHLKFSEPTHFTKFFKKNAAQAPRACRSRQQDQ